MGVIHEGKKEPYMDSVITHIKNANGLDDKDVREMPVQAKDIMQYLSQHPNKTQSIVVFCSNSTWKVGNL